MKHKFSVDVILKANIVGVGVVVVVVFFLVFFLKKLKKLWNVC